MQVPASKSHTIRGVIIASLAHGVSEISNPLDSSDTMACVEGCRALGAEIELGEKWTIKGTAGKPQPAENAIDVANSGTSLYFLMGAAALADGRSVITGDEQTQKRSAEPLIQALNSLGAEVSSTRGNDCAPVEVRGRMTGGHASIRCPTSQYLSSLLLSCPLADRDTTLEVTELNERPYVQMTLDWLNSQNVEYFHERMERFQLPGQQLYHATSETIKSDFSSASFFLCAAAITRSTLRLEGLDMNDSQGDKAIVYMLREMGAMTKVEPGAITITGCALKGGEFDMNATPDALPIMAVTACFAEGRTKLFNVPQARIKETDRIAVMREALQAMGAKVEELEDGLMVEQSELRGCKLPGHGDHRVVMALAVAGLGAKGQTEIDSAESVSVTVPNFVELLRSVGAKIEVRE